MLYDDIYHTVVVAPATSNTVAKCAFGISDSLPTNMFAQAGKLGIPGIVFACDTEPVVVTTLAARLGDAAAAAHRTRQRRAAARDRLLPVVALARRTRSGAAGAPDANFRSHGTHRLPDRAPGRAAAANACWPASTSAPFTWEVREIGLQVAALMTADMIRRRVPRR